METNFVIFINILKIMEKKLAFLVAFSFNFDLDLDPT